MNKLKDPTGAHMNKLGTGEKHTEENQNPQRCTRHYFHKTGCYFFKNKNQRLKESSWEIKEMLLQRNQF